MNCVNNLGVNMVTANGNVETKMSCRLRHKHVYRI